MAIVFTRTLIIYLTLLVTMRLLGKRQLGEMELSEFVLASLIADLAAHPLQDIGIPLINGLVPVLTLFCCEVLIAGLTMRSIRMREFLFGRPSIIIENGSIIQKSMEQNRFTAEELMQELRTQGIYDIARVQYAILETDGKLNVMPCPEDAPLTARAMGLDAQKQSYPSIVIDRGRVMENNLRWLGLERKWLDTKLRALGHSGPENIYLMLADRDGKIYLSPKEAEANA